MLFVVVGPLCVCELEEKPSLCKWEANKAAHTETRRHSCYSGETRTCKEKCIRGARGPLNLEGGGWGGCFSRSKEFPSNAEHIRIFLHRCKRNIVWGLYIFNSHVSLSTALLPVGPVGAGTEEGGLSRSLLLFCGVQNCLFFLVCVACDE